LLLKTVLADLTAVTLTFDPKIRVPLLPSRMCGPSLSRVGQGVPELRIGKVLTHLTLVTLTFDLVRRNYSGASAAQDGCVDQV